MKLSVVIPSYKDPLLHKTVESLLNNSELGDQLEIIITLDGYWTAPIDDPRVKVVHLGKNRGMRDAINAAVAVAQGEFLMRTDEHCMFGPGYDRILTRDCGDEMIMIPRRYYLDTVKWEVMDIPPNDCDKLVIDKVHGKFTGFNWKERAEEMKDVPIYETMAFQGSCWIMKRSWWDKVVVKLQTEGYGPLYQDSHEMSFKTWRAGGKLMTNKNTWFAHRHRDFGRTHNYGTAEAKPGWDYSMKIWMEDYLKIKEKWGI